MTKEELFEIIEAKGQLPTLPSVITSVLELIRNPKTSASDIGNAISSDIALSSKILKIVNSAFYGFPKKIGTVSQAVVILGFNTIKSAILGVSIIEAFEEMYKGEEMYFDRKEFWKHAIGTASTSRVIARTIGYPESEEAFVAGILHDVGKLILDQFLNKQFREVVRRAHAEKVSMEKIEKEIIGFSHYTIGSYIIDRWNFPEHLSKTVLFINNPMLSGDDEITVRLVSIVHIGNIISRALNIGHSGDAIMPRLNRKSWDLLGLKTNQLEEIMENTLKEFKNASDFLNR